MKRVVEAYFHLLKVLIALFLAIMVVLVFGNVVLRYAFNSGITVSEEVSRWLFVWLTFLGAIVAMREHGHLGVDIARQAPADGRQEGLPHRQPAADALRHLAAARRQLGADADQLGRRGAGLRGSRSASSTASASCSRVSTGLILLHDLYRARHRQALARTSSSWSRSPRSRRSSRRCSGARRAATAASGRPRPPRRAEERWRPTMTIADLPRLAARRHGARHADRLRAAASAASR